MPDNLKMMARKFSLIILFLLLLHSGFGQNNIKLLRITAVENGLTENKEFIFADSVVTKHNILDRMKFYKVPSVSIAVIYNGKIEWARAYGYADPENKKLANTETLYQAASISKSINALGVLKLVQDGKLSLDKDIRKYLKSWTFPDNEFSKDKKINLKNLLSHTAGLSTSGFMGYSITDSLPNINQILNGQRPANSEAVKPILPIGTEFKYSGGGITIIRKIIDDNISTNYDSLMQVLVLKPLNMKNSTFSQPLNNQWKNFASAYDTNENVLKGEFYIYPEQAPDGLWTTATDLARFVISIQQALKNNPSAILKQDMAKEMLTPVLSSSDVALGTFIKEKGGEKYFTHSGANLGYRSDYYGSFTTGNGVVILTNSDNGQQLIDEIINSVATEYNWKGFYNPVVKKLINIPDTLLDRYIGVYYCKNPPLKISIVKKGSNLELTARRPERMYAIGTDKFFLSSSPNDICVFSSSGNDGLIDTFEVMQGEKVTLRATRKK